MPGSGHSLGKSTHVGSDQLPVTGNYCEPCYALPSGQLIPVAGHCQNCDENLCRQCFTSHRGHKLFNKHKLVNGSPRPIIQPTFGTWLTNVFNNMVREYMPIVAIILVPIILAFVYFHQNEGSVKIEQVKANCDIVMKQHDKVTTQLETLKCRDKESEHEDKLKVILTELQQLVKLSCPGLPFVSKAYQKAKRPIHVKDITVTSSSDKPISLSGSLVLPNKQMLITDTDNNKLKLIDTNQDKIILTLPLSGKPNALTKIKEDEIAVIVNNPNTIQFIYVSQNIMYKVREMPVDGYCKRISYNNRDQTLIVTFINPPKVKILDMKGNEIKCIEHDSVGNKLFKWPTGVALTPDMTSIYVTDRINDSVTRLSLNGDAEAVYKDKTDMIEGTDGVYVHPSGLVYVVGRNSHTVHELDPESGQFKVVLEEKDRLTEPLSISYCEIEDKMYIGMWKSNVIKVFEMK